MDTRASSVDSKAKLTGLATTGSTNGSDISTPFTIVQNFTISPIDNAK